MSGVCGSVTGLTEPEFDLETVDLLLLQLLVTVRGGEEPGVEPAQQQAGRHQHHRVLGSHERRQRRSV